MEKRMDKMESLMLQLLRALKKGNHYAICDGLQWSLTSFADVKKGKKNIHRKSFGWGGHGTRSHMMHFAFFLYKIIVISELFFYLLWYKFKFHSNSYLLLLWYLSITALIFFTFLIALILVHECSISSFYLFNYNSYTSLMSYICWFYQQSILFTLFILW